MTTLTQSPNKSESTRLIQKDMPTSCKDNNSGDKQVQTGSDWATNRMPTQIATESMKGCGCCIRIVEDEMFNCNEKELCSECKKVNQAHKQDWEGELDNIEGVKAGIPLHKADEEYDCCMYEAQISLNRISELTQALKILEGGK